MLTDFFVAPADDGTILSTDMSRIPDHSTSNADNSVLSALWGAVDGDADTARLAGEEFLVAMGSAEGPWVFALPDDFVSKLGTLSVDALPEIANKWAQSPGLSYHNLSGPDLIAPLEMIKALAEKASSTRQALFLRVAM